MQNKQIIQRLANIEAKLDAILREANITDVETPSIGSPALYNIRVPKQEAEGAVPHMGSTEFTQQTPAPPPLPAKNTAPMAVQVEGTTDPSTAKASSPPEPSDEQEKPDHALPLKEYDEMTVGQVMQAVKSQDLTEEEAKVLLAYEEKNKDRTQVKEFLDNWNS